MHGIGLFRRPTTPSSRVVLILSHLTTHLAHGYTTKTTVIAAAAASVANAAATWPHERRKQILRLSANQNPRLSNALHASSSWHNCPLDATTGRGWGERGEQRKASIPIQDPLRLPHPTAFQFQPAVVETLKPVQPTEPCFDPLERVNVTANWYMDARIPCTVRHIDFSQTVMSWWKEGAVRELTVGNEVYSPRYVIDKSDTTSWTLVIRNVTEADTGYYICQINLYKVREKFYHLTVTRSSNRADRTKLNDEYVKDEAFSLNNTSQRDVRIEGQIHGTFGKPHTLTCVAKFYRLDPSANVQWFHNSQPVDMTHKQVMSSSMSKSTDSKSRGRQQQRPRSKYTTSQQWVDNLTLRSVLRIQRLQNDSAGFWKCRKFSQNFYEPSGEAMFILKVNHLGNWWNSAGKSPSNQPNRQTWAQYGSNSMKLYVISYLLLLPQL